MYPTAFGNRTTTGGCGTPLHVQLHVQGAPRPPHGYPRAEVPPGLPNPVQPNDAPHPIQRFFGLVRDDGNAVTECIAIVSYPIKYKLSRHACHLIVDHTVQFPRSHTERRNKVRQQPTVGDNARPTEIAADTKRQCYLS